MDLIIGAGVSGLSYAAKTNNEYLIIESESSIGGYCKTIYKDGFVWDYSGHFFHFQHPEIRDYVMQNVNEDEVLTVNKYTQILYNGRHIDFPFQMNIHQLDQQEFIDCLYDLFNTQAESSINSFKQMLYSKFGQSIADKFLIPYNTKLYATDLDRLDVDAMGRFFPYANKEQIIKNFKCPANNSYNSTFIYPKRGCIRIIDSIASNVNSSHISLGERVLSIDRTRRIAVTNKREIKYDRLISTMPLPRLLDMCGISYDHDVYTWNKVLVFNLGFDKKGPEKKNCWLYVPESKFCFYRVGFYDNIMNTDKMSLYVEIGYGKDEKICDIDKTLKTTLDDLHQAGIVTDQQLISYHYVVMDPAYVHVTRTSEIDKEQMFKILKDDDIYSIGRYGAWKYCSLEDNIVDAFNLTKNIDNNITEK